MSRHRITSRTLWRSGALLGSVLFVAAPVVGQDEAGDQRFRFGFNQTFEAQDNIRLDPDSAGTTYSSDTRLSFGFDTTTGLNELSFDATGVGRIVNDPVIGSYFGLRDPELDLAYSRTGVNSRVLFDLGYFRPDLAFNDPLRDGNNNEQDFARGGGVREQLDGGFRFETGLTSPLGFIVDLETRAVKYRETEDPLLFDNITNRALAEVNFQLSPVMLGRVDLFEERYRGEDTRNTDRTTRRLTAGIDYDLSPISSFSLDLGHSDVTETFDQPDDRLTANGFVGTFDARREMPNGDATARLSSILTQQGRQNDLLLGRNLELPGGSLDVALGVAQGDTFDPRPIGRLAYMVEGSRSILDISVERTVRISDIVSEATERTELGIGYDLAINQVSSLSLDLFYADASVVGQNTGNAARDRGSFYATYTRNVTPDWDLSLGYKYLYVGGTDNLGPGSSNGAFFNLQRDFDVFR